MMDGPDLSPDARRLTLVLALYGATPKGERAWTKAFTVNAVVYQGVRDGVFKEYDLVPGVMHYQGNDYFAMCSQEAETDLNALFELGFVEKIVLNTQFYTPETAWRLAAHARPLLRGEPFVSEKDKAAVRALVMCRLCGSRCYDYVSVSARRRPGLGTLRDRKLYRVCSCYRKKARYRDQPFRLLPHDELVPGFFSIGDCEYDGIPFFVENINEW